MWLAVLLLAPTAVAKPMTWQWNEGQSRRYVTGARFESPFPVVLSDDRDAWVRSKMFAVQLAMTCEPESTLPNGRGWNMECPIEDANAWAAPVPEDAQHAKQLIDQYNDVMKRSSLAFRLSVDGRISQVHLASIEGEAPPKYVLKTLDTLLAHTLSSLDTQLGDTEEPNWALPQGLAADFPLEGIQSAFNGRVTFGGNDHRELVLITHFEGGYAYEETTFKGDAVQKSYYDPDEHAVQQSTVQLRAYDRSSDTSAGFELTTYIRQVRVDDEVRIDAWRGW